MWSCITLYNRPQVCFTPDLQPEWLLALICIFMGCICITTTVILLASSHFDRNVIPYARWVGFAASKKFFNYYIFFTLINNEKKIDLLEKILLTIILRINFYLTLFSDNSMKILIPIKVKKYFTICCIYTFFYM